MCSVSCGCCYLLQSFVLSLASSWLSRDRLSEDRKYESFVQTSSKDFLRAGYHCCPWVKIRVRSVYLGNPIKGINFIITAYIKCCNGRMFRRFGNLDEGVTG